MKSQHTLTSDEMRLALAAIAAARCDPDARPPCPRCRKPGLGVADRSARPYAEWYLLSCAACGLEATVNIPLGPPVVGGMD